MRKYLLAIAVSYTALVAWLSLATIHIPISIGGDIQGSDKAAHFIAYFVFTIVWFSFFYYSEKSKIKFYKSSLFAFAIGFLYGVLMEYFQAVFTDNRQPELYDVFANTSGTIFALVILKILYNKLIKLKKTD